MNLLEPQSFRQSVRYAWAGLRYVWKHEQNFRIQVVGAAIVLLLAFTLQISRAQWIVLILTVGAVLILELLNTTMERLTDLAQPRLHHYAKAMKDMMAAAVLLASLGAIIIGFLIFGPYFA
jgi:diacylglycerol kinase